MLRPSIQKAIGRFFKAVATVSGGLAVGLGLLGLPGRSRRHLEAAEQTKPNIVVIMGDDIGIWNIGAYTAA